MSPELLALSGLYWYVRTLLFAAREHQQYHEEHGHTALAHFHGIRVAELEPIYAEIEKAMPAELRAD